MNRLENDVSQRETKVETEIHPKTSSMVMRVKVAVEEGEEDTEGDSGGIGDLIHQVPVPKSLQDVIDKEKQAACEAADQGGMKERNPEAANPEAGSPSQEESVNEHLIVEKKRKERRQRAGMTS
ncbi:unnamed protein product [Eruca vesicaria subsp. sativa]|uniref:Uncharacterized protein n=1 Tax=Eruca vesicaria subsp. sativa TaxID=29727 RepID=A0ABC8IR62_ERUVS|nr:unnamed protein product [Eruca vesicaria subsp. sativa]